LRARASEREDALTTTTAKKMEKYARGRTLGEGTFGVVSEGRIVEVRRAGGE